MTVNYIESLVYENIIGLLYSNFRTFGKFSSYYTSGAAASKVPSALLASGFKKDLVAELNEPEPTTLCKAEKAVLTADPKFLKKETALLANTGPILPTLYKI